MRRDCIVVLSPVRMHRPQKPCGRNSARISRRSGGLSQKGTLKMQLKIRRGTLAVGEEHFEVSEGLE